MGLFDKILKSAAKAIDDAVDKNGNTGTVPSLSKMMDNALGMKDKAVGGSSAPAENKSARTPERILESGTAAAKPSRLVNEIFYDGDDTVIELKYTFMLSGDFLPFRSGAGEVDYSALYLPYSSEEHGDNEYDSSLPCFCIVSAPENEIYDMIESCRNGSVPDQAFMFLKVSDLGEKIYFKAKVKLRGNILYFYALDRGMSWENNYIGVSYKPDVMGTPLEKKLMAAVDEAAATYKETIL
ncbi:hypothetical protein [Ruminococcus sp. Marseille-P6503]|uniref:hypothetical protein n=1 Tax=Ruminococcus sp. Marseille-P6503 TaxID=2364796 RepID=UPI000F543EED|nr:hypothetical protein [Ruminococcus sp. Marseille-P6503]